jgi:outer membrane protein OmpA-like peptidoglycan-associated protein
MRRIGYAMAGAALAAAGVSAAWAQEPVPNAREIARACSGDIERFCPGVPPGGGRIKACMKANASHLSAGCFDTLMGAVTLLYTVDSDLAFPPGGWQLSNAGKALFAKLVHKLAPTQDNKIYVSGFTDSTPVGPELQAQGIASNLQLSQMRADNVMQYLISQGVKPDMIAAKGFGDADPVASNATAEGRAKNRRVELSLTPLQIGQP